MNSSDRTLGGSRRVWRNARLATMSESLPGLGVIADGAVAADAGLITYVGPEAGMSAAMTADAEIIDCEGRWMTPGLIDCHT
ncbi:MAG: imidazolonepropionase, partial [Pseudaminobacter sp.]|nr:imidazolonepropionase [Pseudaminobacter sp.]